MALDTYTFFFEIEGGTYISQVKAAALPEAMRLWTQIPYNAELCDRLGSTVDELKEEFAGEDEPVAVSDLEGVWCSSGLLNDHFGLLHIVRSTHQNPE